MAPKFQKGSQWRKWDLHIHAPTAVFNNQFSGKDEDEKWENYFKELEKLTDISVLGITDYWSIDGYKKVKEHKDKGNLKNIDLILPNVELRISEGNNGDKAINLHCIFNPSIADKLDDDFFAKLSFSYKDKSYSCTKNNLIQLGKKIDNETITAEKAYETGCKQFKISLKDINGILEKDSEILNNIFIVVANSNKDGASMIQDNNLQALRQEIYRASDAIFSGNPNDRDYFLGSKPQPKNEEEEKKQIEDIKNKYGSLKPCIHGSDAHDNQKICKPDLNRFTWIKADPTFEGLKQIIYEPKDRVHIGEDKPEQKQPYEIIESIKISHEKFSPKNDMQLNQNLIAIIGCRSSGKSLLLTQIAKTMNLNHIKDVFAKINKNDIPYNRLDNDNFDMDIQLANSVSLQLTKKSSNIPIIYIPQSYLNHLSDVDNKQSLSDTVKSFYFDYDNSKKDYHSVLVANIKNISFEINSIIEEIFKAIETLTDTQSQLKQFTQIDVIKANINSLNNQIASKAKEAQLSDDDIKQYNELSEEINKIIQENALIASDKMILETTNIRGTLAFDKLKEFHQMLNYQDKNQLNISLTNALDTFRLEVKKVFDDHLGLLKQKDEQNKALLEEKNTKLKPLKDKIEKTKSIQLLQQQAVSEQKKLAEYEMLDKKRIDTEKRISEYEKNLKDKYTVFIKEYIKFNEEITVSESDPIIEFKVAFMFNNNKFHKDFYEDCLNKKQEKDFDKYSRYSKDNKDRELMRHLS